MKPLISIVIPVYNTGDILRETLNHIVEQTYTNYEVILVDDGSNDYTANICDEYTKKFEKFKAYHIKNGGVCIARNFGINMAKGEYITFCDHDDVYNKHLLECEINIINKYRGVELVIVGAKHIYDNGKEIDFCNDMVLLSKNEIKEHLISVLKLGIVGTVWNILYKKELIKKIRFDESVKKGHEDILFNMNVLQKAESLVSSSIIQYYHYIRKSMSTSAGYHFESLKSLEKSNNMIYSICKDNLSNFNREDYISLQGEYIRTYVIYMINLGLDKSSFKKNIDNLYYIECQTKLYESLKFHSTEFLSFFCIENNKIMLLYHLIKINKRFRRLISRC